jgi:hypothetical protein
VQIAGHVGGDRVEQCPGHRLAPGVGGDERAVVRPAAQVRPADHPVVLQGVPEPVRHHPLDHHHSEVTTPATVRLGSIGFPQAHLSFCERLIGARDFTAGRARPASPAVDTRGATA